MSRGVFASGISTGDGGVIKTLRRVELDSVSLVDGVEVGSVSRFDAGNPKEKKSLSYRNMGRRTTAMFAGISFM